MCLEISDQNIFRSFVLSAEKKAIFYWWFSHFIFSKRNFKNQCWLSRSYQIHSIFCRNKYQTLLPPYLCPYALSQFFLALPLLSILFPSSSTCLFIVYLQSRSGSCPRSESQRINGGTVSIGTWKEPGSPFLPVHVSVVWPDWLIRSSAPVMTHRNRQGRNCQLWSRH